MELFNLFVGCETGLLKGVNIAKQSFLNIATDPGALVNKERSVDVIFFEDDSFLSDLTPGTKAPKLRLCLRNRDIVCLDFRDPTKHFSRLHVDGGDGKIVGGGMIDKNTVTCVESGEIYMNERMQRNKPLCTAGKNVCKMIQSRTAANIFATAGKENHLKIWNILNPSEPLFTSKNLPDDKLRLSVKTWNNDIKFRPKSDDKIILTATAYHEIQVYDIRAQRRPTMHVSYSEDPLTCLDINPDKEFEVIIANRLGKVALFDLRGTKGIQLRSFTGNQGTVRDVKFHPSESSYFATCGLDRFVRFYNSSQKSFISELYMKSQPSCLLFTEEPVASWSEETEVAPRETYCKRRKPTELEVIESDSIWQEMNKIDDGEPEADDQKRKKKKIQIM